MKRGWLWVALLLSLGINIGVLATSGVTRWRSRGSWERQREQQSPPFARLADHLDLEGQTREEFLAIQRQLFETTRSQREQLQTLRAELRREITSEEPDPQRVERLLDGSGRAYRALDRALVESILACREVLTPAQQRRYFHVLRRMRDGAMRFGGRGGPPNRRPRNPRDRPR